MDDIYFYSSQPLSHVDIKDLCKKSRHKLLRLRVHMSDSNMLTAYSWAAGLFQQQLPSSLMDIEKRAKLVNEINGPLVRGNNPLVADKMLMDLDNDEKDLRLDDIARISMAFLTEQMDDKVRKNILLRLWTGCIEAAKAIRFNYVAGIKDGIVVEAPITHEYRQAIFTSLIDLQSRIDLIYGAGVEAAPAYKKLLKQYYSFSGIPSNSIIRRYSNEYYKE
jgi:hypothetical protein